MRFPTAWLLVATVAASMPVVAQEIAPPKRSVRTGYAQVLRVEPIYQTLTATRMEQRCDGELVPPPDQPRGLARIVDKVRDAIGSEEPAAPAPTAPLRSEEHTFELQSLMRISYAVFCLKKKKQSTNRLS